jgi:hypothetical protein
MVHVDVVALADEVVAEVVHAADVVVSVTEAASVAVVDVEALVIVVDVEALVIVVAVVAVEALVIVVAVVVSVAAAEEAGKRKSKALLYLLSFRFTVKRRWETVSTHPRIWHTSILVINVSNNTPLALPFGGGLIFAGLGLVLS